MGPVFAALAVTDAPAIIEHAAAADLAARARATIERLASRRAVEGGDACLHDGLAFLARRAWVYEATLAEDLRHAGVLIGAHALAVLAVGAACFEAGRDRAMACRAVRRVEANLSGRTDLGGAGEAAPVTKAEEARLAGVGRSPRVP